VVVGVGDFGSLPVVVSVLGLFSLFASLVVYKSLIELTKMRTIEKNDDEYRLLMRFTFLLEL
jgi:hypothetical protein